MLEVLLTRGECLHRRKWGAHCVQGNRVCDPWRSGSTRCGWRRTTVLPPCAPTLLLLTHIFFLLFSQSVFLFRSSPVFQTKTRENEGHFHVSNTGREGCRAPQQRVLTQPNAQQGAQGRGRRREGKWAQTQRAGCPATGIGGRWRMPAEEGHANLRQEGRMGLAGRT